MYRTRVQEPEESQGRAPHTLAIIISTSSMISRLSEMGFSQKMALPALAAAMIWPACWSVGEQITTASTSGSLMSCYVAAPPPVRPNRRHKRDIKHVISRNPSQTFRSMELRYTQVFETESGLNSDARGQCKAFASRSRDSHHIQGRVQTT